MADLADIIEDLTPRSAALGRKAAVDIRATVRRVAVMPLSGRAQDEFDLRKAVTRRYAYLVYYRVRDDIEVVRIQSASQDRQSIDA